MCLGVFGRVYMAPALPNNRNLPTTQGTLPTTQRTSPTTLAHRAAHIAHRACPPRSAHRLLRSAHCLLRSAHCLLRSAHCPPRFSSSAAKQHQNTQPSQSARLATQATQRSDPAPASLSHGGLPRVPAGTPRHLRSARHFQVQTNLDKIQESALQIEERLAIGAPVRPRPGLCRVCVEANDRQPRQRAVLCMPLPARWLGGKRRTCLRTSDALPKLWFRCGDMHSPAQRGPGPERR